jgi:hypothetical protein
MKGGKRKMKKTELKDLIIWYFIGIIAGIIIIVLT